MLLAAILTILPAVIIAISSPGKNGSLDFKSMIEKSKTKIDIAIFL